MYGLDEDDAPSGTSAYTAEDRRMRFTQEAIDRKIASVEAQGQCITVKARADQLLLDLDDEVAYTTFSIRFHELRNLFEWEIEDQWRSKSGKGIHVVVKLTRPMEAARRIALQCALGSDPMREAFAIVNLEMAASTPSILFKPIGGDGE